MDQEIIPVANAWEKTKSGKRILELKQVEENIARLLHFAGCTLASLHPEPISSFTTRDLPLPESDDEDEEDDADDQPRKKKVDEDDNTKEGQFTKYAEAYYNTLNDVQVSLRESIRHLRLARASPAPLIDPAFNSLANPGGAKVSGGGFSTHSSTKSTEEPSKSRTMSVAALQLEKDALEDLIKALRK